MKAVLDENEILQDLYIKAEISNFKHHTPSGHMYFSIKDEKSRVPAVMFRSHAERLRFVPEDGMSVLVRGNVSLYERDGLYQVYVTDMQPDGAGAMALAVQQLKEKLQAEGLFDEQYKKPLPVLPKVIGVITAETGAAIGDITQVLSRRYPIGTMLFYPATVQGAEAVPSLVKAVESLDGRCDVIIIGRGGGSQEDLWAFQDEMLVRAIFMTETPVISAVGHEMDVTICDLVADKRAPTPSAAAELAVPSKEELSEELERLHHKLSTGAYYLLERNTQRLDYLAMQPALKDPTHSLRKKRERLDFLKETLYNGVVRDLSNRRKQLQQSAAMLEILNPFSVLARGYTLVFRDNKPVKSVTELSAGEQLTLEFADGTARTTIDTVQEKDLKYGD